jgi:hypothetical protein
LNFSSARKRFDVAAIDEWRRDPTIAPGPDHLAEPWLRPYKIGVTIAPIKAPRPGNEPSNSQAWVPGCSALNTDLAMSPTTISMSRPPLNPKKAPKGIIAMIIATRRLLVIMAGCHVIMTNF